MKAHRSPAVLLVPIVLLGAVAAWWTGCGDGDPLAVSFQGNVVDVVPDGSEARSPEPPALRRLVSLDWLGRLAVPAAVAQIDCPDEIEDVLACGLDGTDDGARVNCTGVDAASCEFLVQTRLSDPDGGAGFIFVQDDDGDRQFDFDDDDGDGLWDIENEAADEPVAGPDESLEFEPICNGDLITFSDVEIDFPGEVFTADEAEKTIDACAPTPGDTNTPTPTGTQPTATPTVTGTPPTATPTGTTTETPTPSATPTATATGTPPTPTPTATPCDLCADTPCCGLCLAGECI